ncbi:MAG: glutathionylspermidine synthase family protein [Selenomonas sp.]|uniref:glutathionylspermidine synthase family protein n=1 Tax=Selenomonas sp. TaxID=2053611 RepID=UPI0025EF5D46|nr:glutathionylspermidine synthase family protein [Selenomonas sp.]MCR5758478.1 glutathionylspermidine synthase family protein [Selenomonas sp.]
MSADWRDLLNREIFPFVEYEGYADKYPTKNIEMLERELAEELRYVSGVLFGAFQRAVAVCQQCGDNFLADLEIPPLLIPYLQKENSLHLATWLSRFDYVLDQQGNFHMVEINADTPCAVVEAYYGNMVACTHFEVEDPNFGEYDKLCSWLNEIFLASEPGVSISTGRFHRRHPFLFSCFHDYQEDYATTMFLMNAMKKHNLATAAEDAITFVSFYDLAVQSDGSILLPDGRRANAIYRLHPLEILIEEKTPEGDSLGKDFMEGYLHNKFMMFNPPEAIIMQSKAFQALVWALNNQPAGTAAVFSAEEAAVINRYMLPSYFARDFVQAKIAEGSSWIKKPIWGREGAGIEVLDNQGVRFGKDVDTEDIVRRDSRDSMYQLFVEQPSCKADTDSGLLTGYKTLSCFMLGKTPSALYARFSPDQIAGTEAYWLPLGLK